jgi:hypothetical protein
MSIEEVVRFMGPPDSVYTLITDPHVRGIEYAASLDAVATNAQICISYWPRVGVPFDGRNGQGYKIFYAQFDDQRKLQKWLWQAPRPSLGGTLGTQARQERFWRGSYEVGPRPNEEMGAN